MTIAGLLAGMTLPNLLSDEWRRPQVHNELLVHV